MKGKTTILKKILLSSMVIFVLVLINQTLSYLTIQSSLTENKRLHDVLFTASVSLLEADRDLYQSHVGVINLMAMQESDYNNSQKVTALTQDITSNAGQMEERVQIFYTLTESLSLQGLISNEARQKYKSLLPLLRSENQRITENFKIWNKTQKDQWYENTYLPVFNDIRSTIDVMTQDVTKVTDADYFKFDKVIKVINILIIFIMVLLYLTLIVNYIFLRATISKPIKQLDNLVQELAGGDADLSMRLSVKSNDEIQSVAGGFNTFIENLSAIISDLGKSAVELENTGKSLSSEMEENSAGLRSISGSMKKVKDLVSSQVSGVVESSATVSEMVKNIENLDKAIEDQASAVTESSASIEQMVSNIQSVSKNMSMVEKSVQELVSDSEKGRVSALGVAEKVQEVHKKSEALLDANRIISEIARSTNLLAMNAAIEAAHAGSAGRGFSVVADEIRKLAENSAKQSKIIGAALRDVQNDINGVVETSQESTTVFARINEGVSGVDRLEREVQHAMQEQAAGSRQILSALSHINELTQMVKSNSASMKEGGKAVIGEMDRLNTESTEIMGAVEEITANIGSIDESLSRTVVLGKTNMELSDRIASAANQFKV